MSVLNKYLAPHKNRFVFSWLEARKGGYILWKINDNSEPIIRKISA